MPFILQPEMYGEVDPAVLANLPPSMQLGLLLQVSIHSCCFLFQRMKLRELMNGFVTSQISRIIMLRVRRLCQIKLRWWKSI